MRDLATIYKTRIDSEQTIDTESGLVGLYDITRFLSIELLDLLYEEGRYLELPKTWMNLIISTYNETNESDLLKQESSEKIMFLYKQLLNSEYKRLKKKGLSSADSIIVLIRKLLEIINNLDPGFKNKDIKQIKKYLDRFFTKINNKAKKDKLFELECFIKNCTRKGNTGKYRLEELRLGSMEVKKIYQGDISIMDESKEINAIDLTADEEINC